MSAIVEKESLHRAEFLDKKITDIQYIECDFRGASFVNSSVADCSFTDCRLMTVLFYNTVFRNVNFTDCGLNAAIFRDSVFIDCSFQNVNLSYTKCENVEFENTSLRLVSVVDSDIQNGIGVRFQNSTMTVND